MTILDWIDSGGPKGNNGKLPKHGTVSSMTMPKGMYDFYLIGTLNDTETSCGS